MPDEKVEPIDTHKTRVVVCNSSSIVCAGLDYVLRPLKNTALIGTATNTQDAVALCESTPPDLLITDIDLPTLDGILLTRLQKERGAKVLILSGSAGIDQILEALSHGADGYCLNDASSQKIQGAIATILDGGLWFDSSLATTIRKAAEQLRQLAIGNTNQDAGLTGREIEVLRLVAMGNSNVQIAAELIISHETVKTHIRHIMRKLAAADRTQAAIEALRRRILQ
jgi:DNA-binding NarL/FixJ family response regulator